MSAKANQITLFSFRTPQMRAFHLAWFAFFLCFLAWFGIWPLMSTIREDLGLTNDQINTIRIAGVSVTVFARLLIGWLCDRIGPRLAYTWLLLFGSLPVMGVGLAQNYEQLLVCVTLIGAIGAAFVITQFHTSLMFAPNCVGTANATTAGWGNAGGGATQIIMPFLALTVLAGLGISADKAWRVAMLIAGIVCCLTGIAYWKLTQDTPEGNFKDIKAARAANDEPTVAKPSIGAVVSDYRVWILFLAYAACFGIELFINSTAALYYQDQFGLSPVVAGTIAGLFGMMNLFARTTGGFFGDRLGRKWGLRGRVNWLFLTLIGEAVALLCFSQFTILPLAIASMIVFSLFVQMSEGATYSVVPFVNKRSLGLVAGIVGAGGNIGAVTAGFLKKGLGDQQTVLLILAGCIAGCAVATLLVRFRKPEEDAARQELVRSVTQTTEPQPALA
ncbi:MAG: MFS transporter [Planctomycetota bacterium]|jgi:NNP family nitrate/nitrite transporter-like MFS transporter